MYLVINLKLDEVSEGYSAFSAPFPHMVAYRPDHLVIEKTMMVIMMTVSFSDFPIQYMHLISFNNLID